jgi:hypothetical protein
MLPSVDSGQKSFWCASTLVGGDSGLQPESCVSERNFSECPGKDPDPDQIQIDVMNDIVRLLFSASAMSSKAVCV